MPQKRLQNSFPGSKGRIAKGPHSLQPNYYPAYLDLKGKKCVVVGGGRVAERKIRALLKAGAAVYTISPELTPPLKRLKAAGSIRHSARAYKKGDLKGAWLAIAATSDETINKAVSRDAPFLVNVVDAPELANFIAPAVVQSGPLQIAVSTGGSSPAMAASIRRELDLLFGKDIGQYASFIGGLRKKLLERISTQQEREDFFRIAGSPKLLNLVRNKGFNAAKKKIMRELSRLEELK